MKLNQSLYSVRYHDMPKCFGLAPSLQATASWPSPNAEDWSTIFSDLALVDMARRNGEVEFLRFAWLGGLLKCCGNMVVREVRGGVEGPWRLAMGHMTDSAATAWPLKEHMVERSTSVNSPSDPAFNDPRDLFVAVLGHSWWRARGIVSFSPYSQLRKYSAQAKSFVGGALAIRAFSHKCGEALLSCAARSALGSMPKVCLDKLAGHLGVEVRERGLFAIVEALVRHILPPSERALVDIMALRMCKSISKESAAITSFWEVEDAHLCFGAEDRQNFTTARSQCRDVHERQCEYTSAWRKKASACKVVEAKAKPRSGVKRPTAKATAATKAMAKRPLPQGDMTQAEIRDLVPPRGHIWRGSLVGSWQCHMQGFSRFSASWHLYGQRESAVMCLRDLWRKYLASESMDLAECPIDGLFVGDGSAALPPE